MLTKLYQRASARSELRREIDSWAENALAAAQALIERDGPIEADVSELELDSAFAAAEPALEEMITPHSIAEQAAHAVDALSDEHPLASSGAFTTRTMADLLERQGDRRGAARIRAVLGEVDRAAASPAHSPTAIAVLERWLDNVRRLQS